jgi:hypothetical protein
MTKRSPRSKRKMEPWMERKVGSGRKGTVEEEEEEEEEEYLLTSLAGRFRYCTKCISDLVLPFPKRRAENAEMGMLWLGTVLFDANPVLLPHLPWLTLLHRTAARELKR